MRVGQFEVPRARLRHTGRSILAASAPAMPTHLRMQGAARVSKGSSAEWMSDRCVGEIDRHDYSSAGPTTPTRLPPAAFSLASVVNRRHRKSLANARYSAS